MAKADSLSVEYSLSMPKPETHLFEVQVIYKGINKK